MKELENEQQMNQVEAPTRYEAPTLEVIEVIIPKGFDPSPMGAPSSYGAPSNDPDGW
jgi:hypothetical protein